MKGLKKVNGEMNLIMLVYNIKRTLSILGFTKMMEALQKWKPGYSQIVLPFLWNQIKTFRKHLTGLFFLHEKILSAIYECNKRARNKTEGFLSNINQNKLSFFTV